MGKRVLCSDRGIASRSPWKHLERRGCGLAQAPAHGAGDG